MKYLILTLLLITNVALSQTVIMSDREGQSIDFWTHPTAGSLTKQAEISDDGTLQVNNITAVGGGQVRGSFSYVTD